MNPRHYVIAVFLCACSTAGDVDAGEVFDGGELLDVGEVLDEGAPCAAGCICIEHACRCNDPRLEGDTCE